jgi:hypothetical protein
MRARVAWLAVSVAVMGCGGRIEDERLNAKGGSAPDPQPPAGAVVVPSGALPPGLIPQPACRRGDAPMVLATIVGEVDALAVGGGFIYFVSHANGPMNATVARVPTHGGGVQVLAAGQPESLDVAVDASRVYWTAKFDVRSVALDGGEVVVIAQESGRGLAQDDTNLYIGRGVTSSFGTIRKIEKQGGGVTTLADVVFNNTNTVAVDATSVYWLDDTHVMRVSKSGGSSEIAAHGGNGGGIAIDTTAMYFTGLGSVLAHSWASGRDETVAQTMMVDHGPMAQDDRFLYVADQNDGKAGHARILQVTKQGGALRVVAGGLDFAWSPVVDDACVYWMTADRVMRAPKLD